MICDFCKEPINNFVYNVPESYSNTKIGVCEKCGLVQSYKFIEIKKSERIVSASSGADWGNIRHGKGLRLNLITTKLDQYINWNGVKTVLDIGSNRGDFVKWIANKKLNISITGIEPDVNIIKDYKDLPYIQLINGRYENIKLNKNYFDFIYCSHTLEHADSASTMLEGIRSNLKLNGYVFLEIPNLAILDYENNVEEFFIDKHKYHFDNKTLSNYLKFLRFEVIKDFTDKFNISLLLQKTSIKLNKGNYVPVITQSDGNKTLIKKYIELLPKNRERLIKIADVIHKFTDRQSVAVWGAGRIFDALVKYGGLKTEKISCLIDEYLSKYISEFHNIEINEPDYLKRITPQVVIVLARSSTEEISNKIRVYGIKNVIKFDDLFYSSC